MWEWAVEFKALFLFVGSRVEVGCRVQGAGSVCRVSSGSGPKSSRLCSCLLGLMWEWAVEFKALLMFVGPHVGVGR